MKVIKTEINGVLIVEPKVFGDTRGHFLETHHQARYETSGINRKFVQDNLSYSEKNILRGLHFQVKKPQAKLVQVVTGEVFDVAVDLRKNSPTFGKWTSVILSETNRRQFFIPEGFAHGFCVLSDNAHFMYKCSDYYDPEDEAGILWSDPDIGIRWPVGDPVISEKDKEYSYLSDLDKNHLLSSFGN